MGWGALSPSALSASRRSLLCMHAHNLCVSETSTRRTSLHVSGEWLLCTSLCCKASMHVTLGHGMAVYALQTWHACLLSMLGCVGEGAGSACMLLQGLTLQQWLKHQLLYGAYRQQRPLLQGDCWTERTCTRASTSVANFTKTKKIG